MTRFQDLADSSFEQGFPTEETARTLRDELFFQRAVQAYLWSLPAINIWAMKEGSERTFGAGNTVLPLWQKRIDARTLVTTPNFDVVYAMGYLDLADGPLAVEVPPGILGMFDDFWQRPVQGPTIDGHLWKGDVGMAGPDRGGGGTYVGPENPGEAANWLRTVPGQGYFVILRLYGPEQAFFDKSWVPGEMQRVD